MEKINKSDLETINKNLEFNYDVIIIMNPEQYRFKKINDRIESLGFEGIYKSTMTGHEILNLLKLDFIESVELDLIMSINEEE